jgi:hypothetical protein
MSNRKMWYNAIGVAIAVSDNQNNFYRNNIICSSSHSKLLTFGSYDTFVDRVKMIIKQQHIGLNFDLYGAINFVASSMVTRQWKPSYTPDIKLYIISNMQFNNPGHTISEKNFNIEVKSYHLCDIIENINTIFKYAGCITTYKMPYLTPKIVFWNCGITNYFPTHALQNNVFLTNGNTPESLNMFKDKVIHKITYDDIPRDELALRTETGRIKNELHNQLTREIRDIHKNETMYTNFRYIFNNERYKALEDKYINNVMLEHKNKRK